MAIAVELAGLLKAKGWTVRRLRDEQGYGTSTAVRLLDPSKRGLASAASMDKALGLVGKELWHRRRLAKG